MTSRIRILVVAATSRELASPNGWRAHACGVGPVEAAASTAAAIAEYGPHAVLHVGIAGARRARALTPASLVIGSASHYCDLTIPAAWAPSTVSPSPLLLESLRETRPDALVMPIGTSARIGGTLDCASGCDVEAMEGFGVLRAAQLAGVPAIEVRAISNEIEEDDRARWHFAAAFAAITGCTPLLVDHIVQRLVHA